MVEGVGAGAAALAPYVSLLIWVDAPERERRARALARDGDGLYPDEEWRRWAALEDAYVARERPARRADLTVGSL